jgi:hypothetical protein
LTLLLFQRRGIAAVFVTGLLGCAVNGRSSAEVSAPAPDCSFRSPTTCWSVRSRFPDRERPPAPPDEQLGDSASVLVIRNGSAPGSSTSQH